MKHQTHNRILSFFLAIIMLCTSAPFPVNSVETGDQAVTEQSGRGERVYDYDSLKITKDGIPITNLGLQSHEKIEISADGISLDADYQWQVQHPEKDDVWVNIYDGTQQSISVTAALVNNVLRTDNTAKLRCQAYVDNYAYLTSPITVTLMKQETVTEPTVYYTATKNDAVMTADGEETPEFVTITVNYLRYDYITGTNNFQPNGEIAYAPYEATLLYNGPLGNSSTQTGLTIPIPTMVGYDGYLAAPSGEPVFEDAVYDNGISVIREVGQPPAIYIEYRDHITENIELTIHYMPAMVDYTVHYFFQNIYDDNYVEKSNMAQTGKDRTGHYPDIALVGREFDGFTSMYYEPAAIAADGTTVFEVYYERNYYLMDFHCNGGYGASPVYVRYEAYISVPDPIYPGWSFQGWDMTGAWDDANKPLKVRLTGDGLLEICDTGEIIFADKNKDNLPLTMPCFNTSFKAIWTEADTTYTVAYWIKDPNGGNNHTFLGSRAVPAKTGDPVEIRGDYFQPICGKPEHTSHIDGCYDCGKVTHVHHYPHSLSCYSFVGNPSELGAGDDKNVINATNEKNGVSSPNNGDIYFISSDWNSTSYWPKLYWGGVYYTITIDGKSSISLEEIAKYTVGGMIGERGENPSTQYNGTLYADRYRAKPDCNLELCEASCQIEEHNHIDSACRVSCAIEIHDHTSSCYFELAQYVEFDLAYTEDKKQVNTVAGDGSTVLNEFYDYKTYEIRFVFARSSLDTNGNPAYQIASLTNDGSLGGCSWANVSSFPVINKYPPNTQGYLTFEKGIFTYYYIYLRAKYDANIYNLWPANNVDNIDNYIWGSWASESGSPYRIHHQNNANIMGIYPTMSAELINDVTEKIDTIETEDPEGNTIYTNVYLAQTMIAWWGDTGMSILPHAYHNYLELISLPDGLDAQTISTNGREPTSYNGKYYIRREYTNDQGEILNKYYELLNDQFVANHDGYTRVYPAEFIGFEIFDRASHEGKLARAFANNDACTVCGDNCDYCNVFLFDRTTHRLYFWNVNGNLGDGSGSEVRYGASLYLHGAYFDPDVEVTHIPNWNPVDMNTQFYPSIYEPGAYKFAGWYSTPNFVEGTKMEWEKQTMPDADFTVYAKWEPVSHNVYFYLDYDHLQAGTLLSITDVDGNAKPNPMEVSHAQSLQFQLKQPTKDGYIFLGWFYMDGTEKKRFSPETMGFKRGMQLFAEWYMPDASIEYEVRYCTEEGIEIAPSISGHSGVGHTKTFQAKGGKEVLEEYRQGYFPKVASHSILMKPEDPSDPDINKWTFEYVQDDEVSYRIRFLDIADQRVLRDEIVKTTNQVVVTERFMPISGYTPLPGYFYQTKSLCSDEGYPDGHPDNVITFYYIEDTEHGVYSIEYYLEDLPVQGQPLSYSMKTSFTNTADLIVGDQVNRINSGEEFDILDFDGFTFDHAKVINYEEKKDANDIPYMEESIDTISATQQTPKPPISGTIDKNGLTIRLYYSRNNVEYSIKYVDNESGNVLYNTGNLVAPVGSVITHIAPETCAVASVSYNYYQKNATEKQRTKTMTLRATKQDDPATPEDESVVNELIFYYLKPVLTIYYKAICREPEATGFGGVTYSNETSSAGTLSGSTAIAGYGYRFVGWYTDEDYQTPATQDESYKNAFFKPTSWPTTGDSVTYYALFEPVLTTLKIEKVISDPYDGNGDTFLFRIKGEGKTAYIDLIISIQGNGSVLIDQLPVGTYNVSELTGWSYQYTTDQAELNIAVGEDDANRVEFTSTYQGSDWLGDETSVDNDFGEYVSQTP